MVKTNTAVGLGSDDWLRRAIEQRVDQPDEGVPTDSQYTEGQTPADLEEDDEGA